MLNLLEDYVANSLPREGDFATNPNLTAKVGPDGAFLPFCGNTVVFELPEETKAALGQLQEELYRKAGWMLAQRLDPATFHMTLHDLVHGPERTEQLGAELAEAEEKAKGLLRLWRDQPPLRMRTTWLFQMVNTSVVLGLAPAAEDSWRRLDAMYTALEAVVPLGYGLTPHITMGYFRPGTYAQADLTGLRSALRPVTLPVVLSMEALAYQTFSDMNHYRTE